MGIPQDSAPYSSVEEAKAATETNVYCESFRYYKSVDNGGLAQMQHLLQFGRVLSRCIQ